MKILRYSLFVLIWLFLILVALRSDYLQKHADDTWIHTFLNRCSLVIFKKNKLSVEIGNELNSSLFEIEYALPGSDFKNIYKNNSIISSIKSDKGNVYFNIIYKGQSLCKVGHLRTNDWHVHLYKIKIEKASESIIVDFYAHGPDEYHETKKIVM